MGGALGLILRVQVVPGLGRKAISELMTKAVGPKLVGVLSLIW